MAGGVLGVDTPIKSGEARHTLRLWTYHEQFLVMSRAEVGGVQNQWVAVRFNLISVILVKIVGLPVPHDITYANLTQIID